jgi:plastocyanin
MKKLLFIPLAALALAGTGVASAGAATKTAAPKPTSTISISVAKGSLHFDTKTLTAKAGLVQINFTNNSTAPHNVSLEHDGEFEFGSTLTINKSITSTFLTLAKGTYHVYSSVGKDEDKGMSATLTVT